MNCLKTIMQGDAYAIQFRLTNNGLPININDIDKVEFIVGNLQKVYPGNNIIYEISNNTFYFPITQLESMKMEGPQHIQVRVKDISGNVIGKVYGNIQIQFSDSEVIL